MTSQNRIFSKIERWERERREEGHTHNHLTFTHNIYNHNQTPLNEQSSERKLRVGGFEGGKKYSCLSFWEK